MIRRFWLWWHSRLLRDSYEWHTARTARANRDKHILRAHRAGMPRHKIAKASRLDEDQVRRVVHIQMHGR